MYIYIYIYIYVYKSNNSGEEFPDIPMIQLQRPRGSNSSSHVAQGLLEAVLTGTIHTGNLAQRPGNMIQLQKLDDWISAIYI